MRANSGFRDPARRPRYFIWALVLLMMFVMLWAFGIVGTSFAWFCEEPCHKVHYDNTLAYNASTHSKVSCIACHEPVEASPLTFTAMKIFVLPDLYTTITDTFHLPMNANNDVALEMPSAQCTQCHNLKTSKIDPSAGTLIDHDVHAKNQVQCTLCHNRVAHPEEDITLVLPGDEKHENWMRMDACFRCHGLQQGADAPGACGKCHPADFKLIPASHEATGWYAAYGDSRGHADAALAESEPVAAAGEQGEAETTEGEGGHERKLPSATSVNTCYTCHTATLCSDCHGLAMPHPTAFKKDHGKAGYERPQACAKCHARSATEAKGTAFCSACHHPASTPGGSWLREHDSAVRKDGADSCFVCHEETQCSYCHVNGSASGRARLGEDFSQ